MTATAQWLLSRTGPSRGMPTLARLRLFRNCRLAVAAVMLGAFPIMAAASGEPTAVIVSLLLLGVLPAVAALEMRRPARIDRAVLLSLVIMAAVLTGGVLRGLPGVFALLAMAMAGVEAFIVTSSRRRGILAMIMMAALTALALAMHLAAAIPEMGSVLMSAAVIAFSMVVNLGMLAQGMMGVVVSEKATNRRQEIQHSDLEAAASETIVALDRSGSVLRTSGNAGRILGLSEETLTGRGLAELILVADRPAFLTALSDSVHDAMGRSIRVRMRASAEANSPSYRWIAMSVSPSRTASDVAIAALRDIDAQVQEEHRLEAVAADAETAKSTRVAFLATVNHELRTPLNAIIGFSDILANPKSMPTDATRAREYAALINGAGRDLLRMVCSMIDITRLDSGIYEFEAETQDLSALVESTVEAFRQEPEAEKTSFNVNTPEGPIEGNVDARALRSVLQQLLSNAAKFGGSKGAVTISVTSNGDYAMIAITDSGPGIPKDKIALLGRNFTKLDERMNREQGGIGLGLSLVRGLVALHKGTIAIESQPGKGTTVTLSLPRHASAPDKPMPAASSNIHSLTSSNKTVKDRSSAVEKHRDRRVA